VNIWPYMPPALAEPRFRLYAFGHGVSVLGGWIQQVALGWLIFRLTKSVFLLGLTGFIIQIPFLLLGPFTGAIVDRYPRLKLLIAIDLFLAVLASLLAVMAWTGVEDVRAYLVVAALIGCANALEMPTRQSLLATIVGDRTLFPSALAMSATLFNLGRFIGPAIAGIMLLYVSEAWCFAINAISFSAIVWALLQMRLPADVKPTGAEFARTTFIQSASFLITVPSVRYLLPTMTAVGLFGTAHVHLMPSIAAALFSGGPETIGLLMSAGGLGAVICASYLSLQRGTARQRQLVTVGPLVLGLAIMAVSQSRSVPLSFCLFVVVGGAIMLTAACTNIIVQQSVPDAWRGRAVSLYAMSFQGTGPIGHLLAGAVAAKIGVGSMLLLNGILIAIAAVVGRRLLQKHPEALDDAAR
jgi:MFS family permease